MEKNRIQFIDIARGIAIICIILGHMGSNSINRVVFTFHVPIFYFITGYFTNNKIPVRNFIKNKFKTLLIPYACTCLVIILLAMIKSGILYGTDAAIQSILEWLFASLYGAGGTLKAPFYIIPIGAIWFLWATFWGSMFLRCSLNLKRGYRMVMVSLLFIIGYWSREWMWFPYSIQAGCCATLFMYLGYLLRESKDKLKELSMETKIAGTIMAFLVWLEFIKNFKSFWLVSCDIGRGAIDIFGCICGCYIVVLVSRFIEKHIKLLADALAFLGKYSLFMLCVHIVELNLFPWWQAAQKLVEYGMPERLQFYFIIFAKLLLNISLTVVLANWNLSRKLFGMQPKRRNVNEERSAA